MELISAAAPFDVLYKQRFPCCGSEIEYKQPLPSPPLRSAKGETEKRNRREAFSVAHETHGGSSCWLVSWHRTPQPKAGLGGPMVSVGTTLGTAG